MGRPQVESRRAETLPYSWYTDPDVAARRARADLPALVAVRRAISGELDGPGSMFPTHVGGLPLVVVLDGDGELRAFLNVCRHRGTVLVHEPQRAARSSAPTTPGPTGSTASLRGAPRSKDEPDFDMDCLGLVPAQVGTWGPFVFANPDIDAPGLDVALGDLPEVVAENGIDVDALRFHDRGAYEIKANWKIAIENYLECYHCQLNHPGFVKVIDEQRQRMEVGRPSPQPVPARPRRTHTPTRPRTT